MLANEHVNQRMAGPSIRCFELSRALHEAGHEVTLGTPFPTDLTGSPFDIVVYDGATLPPLVDDAEVVVLQGWVLERFPWLATRSCRIVVDLYDPYPLEVLVLFDRYSDDKRLETHRDAVRSVSDQMSRGDFFLCASEKQLDFWTGWLTSAGRINPDTYRADPRMRTLIDVVPFGIPDEPPVKRRSAIRNGIEGIGPDDVVLLWGGGIYNWFDPVTLVRATAEAAKHLPSIRLVFMSAGHPNPDIQEMWTLTETRSVANQLGVAGRNVFFNESWVAYDARADWLLDADIGVTTHFDHIETRYSFRTRVLDYLWAGLPVICTAGDTLADEIIARKLGAAIPAEDVMAATAAIMTLAVDARKRSEYAQRARKYATTLRWSVAAQPLIRYCSEGARAADWRRLSTRRSAVPSEAPAAAAAGVTERRQDAGALRSAYRALPEPIRNSRAAGVLKRLAYRVDRKRRSPDMRAGGP